MPRLWIVGVIFDELNTTHVTRHGVTVHEISALLMGDVAVSYNRAEQTADYIATGDTDFGGDITVAFTYDTETNTARPIAAWRN